MGVWRSRRRYRSEPLTLRDRALFGALSACLGLVLGFALSIVLVLLLHGMPPMRAVVVFSGLLFFCAGFIRGADAGFFVGDALSAVGLISAVETGAAGHVDGLTGDDQPKAWSSAAWLTTWLVGVVVIIWRG